MEGLDTSGNIKPEKIREYEEILWQRAQEFSVIRQALQQKLDELDDFFKGKLLDSLNLHEREVRAGKEGEYWGIKGEIDKIPKSSKPSLNTRFKKEWMLDNAK